MQKVVNPLGEHEEVLVARDHHPARVDTRPARVREQRDEHLGHPTALRSRIDVPHHAPVKSLAAALDGMHQTLVVLGREHRPKGLQVQRADWHMRQNRHQRRSYSD